eukprot:g25949.t1
MAISLLQRLVTTDDTQAQPSCTSPEILAGTNIKFSTVTHVKILQKIVQVKDVSSRGLSSSSSGGVRGSIFLLSVAVV